jgi:hypothetical protein
MRKWTRRCWEVALYALHPVPHIQDWVEILVVVGLLFGVGFTLFAPGSWFAIHVTPHRGGQIAVFIAVLLVLVFVAAVRLRAEIDRRAESAPRIIVRATPSVGLITAALASAHPMERLQKLVWIANVDFCNEPMNRLPEAVARNVVARLAFFEEDRVTPLLITQVSGEIFGRWADTDEPATLDPMKSRRDLHAVTFDVNGLPHSLDLVMKPRMTDTCYATDNMHCLDAFLNYRLWAEQFCIRVRLTGERVDDAWWFSIDTNGMTNMLVTEIPKPALRPSGLSLALLSVVAFLRQAPVKLGLWH